MQEKYGFFADNKVNFGDTWTLTAYILDNAPSICQTIFMPSKKTHKTSGRTSTPVVRKTTGQTYASDMSYDTKLIIVLLLLLFFYPIGLIFMWVWMKNWKWWAKFIITLPLIIGILAALFAILAFKALLHEARNERVRMEQYRIMHERQMQQNNSSGSGQFYLSPSTTILPSSGNTY